jgi:hypothetical protein
MDESNLRKVGLLVIGGILGQVGQWLVHPFSVAISTFFNRHPDVEILVRGLLIGILVSGVYVTYIKSRVRQWYDIRHSNVTTEMKYMFKLRDLLRPGDPYYTFYEKRIWPPFIFGGLIGGVSGGSFGFPWAIIGGLIGSSAAWLVTRIY